MISCFHDITNHSVWLVEPGITKKVPTIPVGTFKIFGLKNLQTGDQLAHDQGHFRLLSAGYVNNVL